MSRRHALVSLCRGRTSYLNTKVRLRPKPKPARSTQQPRPATAPPRGARLPRAGAGAARLARLEVRTTAQQPQRDEQRGEREGQRREAGVEVWQRGDRRRLPAQVVGGLGRRLRRDRRCAPGRRAERGAGLSNPLGGGARRRRWAALHGRCSRPAQLGALGRRRLSKGRLGYIGLQPGIRRVAACPRGGSNVWAAGLPWVC